ncbi:MAG: DinB family protein [Gemmatimonadota bacterium]
MSAPTGTTPRADGFGFWDRQLDRLGGRDPVAVLAETPAAVTDLVSATRDASALRRRPGERAWSALEVVGHLIDVEWVFGFRTRTVLCDEVPEFGGIDQDRWVAVQRWNERDPADLLERFSGLRRVNLSTWAQLRPAELERSGLHRDAGVRLSLDLMRRILAGHDLQHMDQIRAALAGASGGTG